MSVDRDQLLTYLTSYLEPERFNDYCPNGLQVEGRGQIARLATGVTACQALLDQAAEWGADAVLVHHGYFWRGEAPEIVGMKQRRLKTLLGNDMNLIAYHLPLDAHPEVGNNARLGELLGISAALHCPLDNTSQSAVGSIASLTAEMPMAELLALVAEVLQRDPLHVGDRARRVKRIAWCTGGAQEYIEQAVTAGADVYITGEVSEQTVHVARESGIEFVAAGHHATERFGVQALGDHLAGAFNLEHRFFDIDNPA
jgi:dinuclear metal center YbgI/SA1388 family protein